MSSTDLTIDSSQPLAAQLDNVFEAVKAKLSAEESQELLDQMRCLHSRTHHLIRLAKQYDFKDIEANGYWTYVRLIIKFGKLALVSQPNHYQTHLMPVLLVLSTGLDLCDRFHSANAALSAPDLFACPPEQFMELLSVFKSLSPQLDVVYGYYCSYWLCPSMRRVMSGFTTLMAIYSGNSFSNWWQSSKSLWDRTYRAHTVAYIAQNATVEFVKNFWGLTEVALIKNTLPTLVVRSGPKHIRDVYIGRQNRWRISAERAEIIDLNQSNEQEVEPNSQSKIRCRLLQSAGQQTLSGALVLHIHGGGFVSQSPDSHELYLREWANKLDGVPILSVDYSLSPEYRYPIALQQILDSYLWATSEDSQVLEVLGFHPNKIVICGDSAGGNLSLALCLVLNDIRKAMANCSDDNSGNRKGVTIPKGIVCFYTPLMLQTRASPSRLMTAIDTLLPLGVLLSCLEAYAPSDPKPNSMITSEVESDDNQSFEFSSLHFQTNAMSDATTLSMDDLDQELGNDFEHITYDDVPPDEDIAYSPVPYNWSNKWCNSFAKLKNKLIGADQTSITAFNPWYRQSADVLSVKLERLNASTNNYYVSPLLSSPDFDDIPLYLIGLHYDACLDDSIEMAKKWKGPVVLDILDELPHGFLNFVPLSEEGQRGSMLCLDRIKQALI